MKKGYTLAEVLICVAIIGVLAAILVPLANKFKPDATKAMYVKTYDALVNMTRDISSNAAYYPMLSADGKYNYQKAPLFNLQEVSIGKDTSGNELKYGGNAAKFCQLLALSIESTLDAAPNCSVSPVSYSEASFNTPSFTTSRGVEFVVGTDTDGTTTYKTDIYVDVNGKNGNNCLYDSSKCKHPDRFKFLVSADGHVIPADPIGIEYLKTRMNWRKSDIDTKALPNNGNILAALPDDWNNILPETVINNNNDDDDDDDGGDNGGDDGKGIGVTIGVPAQRLCYEGEIPKLINGKLSCALRGTCPKGQVWYDEVRACRTPGVCITTMVYDPVTDRCVPRDDGIGNGDHILPNQDFIYRN